VDIVHLAMDVTPDFQARTITATTSLRFKALARRLASSGWMPWTCASAR